MMLCRVRGAHVFLVASLSVMAASGQPQRRWMMDNPLPLPSLQAMESSPVPGPSFVQQAQDHFDDTNGNSWQQAYFVNASFWTPGSDAPIFLCVGGEGPPMDGSAVVKSVHCNVAVEWAQEKKALIFALEHRYYGCHNMSACPVSNFSQTAALKHLSSRQAIEDVANFVHQMNKQYGLSQANRWVTFGGSYPGMLAGWSRLHHPELIHAAVASSAPVHAKLDMFEYNDAAANAYTVSDNDVGGSEACRAAIREGHRKLEVMLGSSEGIASAETFLGFEKGALATLKQQQDLLGQGAAYFPSQGNDPACNDAACNIKLICKIMLEDTTIDEFHRLVVVRKAQTASKQLQSSPALPDFWYYQTCTEFGFYQTCMKGSKCMFPQITDVEYMAKGCEQYGIKVPEITTNIEATNKHYGGLTPIDQLSGAPGSCVVWPNGEVDPWARLSILKSPAPEQPVIWVEGASHHAWTHPSAESDQVSVVEARGKIRKQVEAFLSSPCGEKSMMHQTQIVV